VQRQDPSQATSARRWWTISGTLASPHRILAAMAGAAADILAESKMAGGEARRAGGAAQSNGGWRCGQPPLSLIGCHARRHGSFSGRRRLERGLAARFRSLSGHPFEALRPKRVPGGSSFEAGLVGIPFRGPYARRLRCRRTSIRKVGSASACACASRFFLRSPCHSLRRLSSLRMSAACRGGNALELFRPSGLASFRRGRSRPHPEAALSYRVAQADSSCG
jgi:hypothetical protein